MFDTKKIGLDIFHDIINWFERSRDFVTTFRDVTFRDLTTKWFLINGLNIDWKEFLDGISAEKILDVQYTQDFGSWSSEIKSSQAGAPICLLNKNIGLLKPLVWKSEQFTIY